MKQNVRSNWQDLLAEKEAAIHALKESEARFRSLIEGSLQGIVIHYPDGKPLCVNQAFVDAIGFISVQEFLALATIEDAIDPGELGRSRLQEEEMTCEGAPSDSYHFKAVKKDGTVCILEVSVCWTTWEGKPAIQTTVIDVTDRETIRMAAAEAEEKLCAIAAASQNAIILIDSTGKVDFWNDGAEAIFGYSPEEAVGVGLANLVIPEPDRERHRDGVARLAQSGGSEVAATDLLWMQALRRTGEIFPAELSISPVRIQGQWGAVGIVSDVSERHRVEKQLKRDIEYQKAIADTLKVSLQPLGLREKLAKILELVVSVPGLGIQGKGSIFLSTDAGTLELCAQKNLAEPLIESCSTIPFGYCLCGRAARSRQVVYADCIDQRHDVRYPGMQPHGHYCVPILSCTGRVLGVLNTYVNERHEEDPQEVSFLSAIATTLAGVIEQQQIEEQYRGLSQAVEQSPASVVITNTDGDIEYVNSKFVEITGYSAEEVLGKNPRVLKSGETPMEEYQAMWQAICAGLEWRCEFHNVKKNGELFIESASISPIRNTEGIITHFVAVKEDITERKSMESQLAHAQKMESIGQLAAGIAHEINTPTQYVGDNLRFLEEAYGDTHRMLEAYETVFTSASRQSIGGSEQTEAISLLKEELDIEYLAQEVPNAIAQALEGVERVGRIVGAMKQFAHPGSTEKVPADLNAAIESTVIVARNEWKYVANLDLDLDANLPPVPCLISDINQVVLNMIINAAHAIEEKQGEVPDNKGTITITTRWEQNEAVIRIRDSGAGIPEHLKTRIFDLFFTTKPVGKGTGQGLAISHNVVHEKHGGYISCDSVLGQGTTFGIHLPLNGKETRNE